MKQPSRRRIKTLSYTRTRSLRIAAIESAVILSTSRFRHATGHYNPTIGEQIVFSPIARTFSYNASTFLDRRGPKVYVDKGEEVRSLICQFFSAADESSRCGPCHATPHSYPQNTKALIPLAPASPQIGWRQGYCGSNISTSGNPDADYADSIHEASGTATGYATQTPTRFR